MWRDVVIGEGDAGNSAVVVSDYNGPLNISENRVSYWISGLFLEIGMTIFKDTDEGESLGFMLTSGSSDEVILEHLENLALDRIDRKVLRGKIEEALADSYRRGGDDRAGMIRKALGIW